MSYSERRSLEELARECDVSVRTIRFYIASRLLPGPFGRGKGAFYTATHAARLQLIRRLVERHLPLEEVAAQLMSVTDDDIHEMLRTQTRQDEQLQEVKQSHSPRAYLDSLLQASRRHESVPPPAPRAAIVGAPTVLPGGAAIAPPVPSPTQSASTLAHPVAAGAISAAAPMKPGALSAESLSPEFAWRRWQLADGIELHVREDVIAHMPNPRHVVAEALRSYERES